MLSDSLTSIFHLRVFHLLPTTRVSLRCSYRIDTSIITKRTYFFFVYIILFYLFFYMVSEKRFDTQYLVASDIGPPSLVCNCTIQNTVVSRGKTYALRQNISLWMSPFERPSSIRHRRTTSVAHHFRGFLFSLFLSTIIESHFGRGFRAYRKRLVYLQIWNKY